MRSALAVGVEGDDAVRAETNYARAAMPSLPAELLDRRSTSATCRVEASVMDRNTFFLGGEVDRAAAGGLLRALRSVAGLQFETVAVDCMDLTFSTWRESGA
jgi:hypothetical protein